MTDTPASDLPPEPTFGQYMIHVLGEGHDAVFDTLAEAQAAAKVESRRSPPPYATVYILQVVDVL